MKTRSARLLSSARLATLGTERLLAYRDNLLSLQESLSSSDWDETDIGKRDAERVYFKDDPRWVDAYAALKRELKKREHVDR
ncbi:MAG: hypothetical protein H6718_19770 [Polyangiaceae bacterium]|nr:hypothetical protein [Polyangiaceae bacterium]MCB9605551.1 hypothetical protein [Polyangiaceae bacterium]